MQIHLQFFRKGSPKSYARMGRAEALVARWLSEAVSAIATQVPNAKYRCSLAECTVSSGADRSERSEDKKGEKNYLFLQTVKKMGTIIILRQLSVLYLHITSSLTARKIDTLLYNV